MNCAACGHENRPGRKFCAECGAALALACAGCGTPYEAGEKFCGECGAALGAAAPRRTAPETPRMQPGPGATSGSGPTRDAGARKIVTIVFADLVGSTALHERVDAESARRLMERYYLALRRAVEAQGGTVVKLLGDGVMAAFGLDRVAEDDALRAVRAAAAMQDAFRALVRAEGAALGTVGLRVAVNTGEVVVAGAADDVIGDPVNVAARLQEQGRDGDVVIGETTHRLVATRVTLAPLGSVTLKGRAEAVAAHRLVSLDPPAGAAAAPFVGRDAELVRLERVFDAAVTTPATRLAVLIGSPGLGKSRLIDELARRHADDATILAAHCDAAGGATFAPLAQALRRFLGLTEDATGAPLRTAVAAVLANGADDGERTRIAAGIDGLLTGAPTSPEETFFVVRRFLAGLAAARPVVLVVDDLHWAEPLLLDLVEHLVQWGSGVRLFVLVGARPELRELRSSLVTPGGIVGDVVMLGGLDAGAAMRLAAGVIGAADLPAAVAAKVLATSEGNPLFVGELVRMLVQEGALTREGDRWTAGASLAALEMPPTIHALLAARIERLRPEERTVLERAAVVGRHFSRSAVAALLGRRGAPSDARDTSDLDARLESLRRSELIERDTGWLLGEPALRFHHVLIRDAAYRRLLKGTRAELHAELADWIEARVGDAPEHDETIGRHLEQAHQLLRELGPLDAAAVALGERAARRLAAAGRRALARDDVSLAAGLLGRALARLGEAAPERADLVLDWCEALLAAGDVGPAADAIAELDRIANEAANHVARGATAGAPATGTEAGDAARDGRTDARRLRAWHTCFAGQLTVLTAPEALNATAEQVGAAALELAQLDDAAGEAKAHFVHAQALARLGKIGACEAALDHALAAARRAGDRRRANAILAGAPLAALWGPSPVTRASGRCLDVVRVLRITQGAPAVEAVALSCQGVLEALRGRTEAARRMLASSRTMVEELGIAHRLYETEVFAGRVDLLEGDAAAAERSLRAGYEGLRDLGLGIDAARAAALLGRALLAQDRAAEAETLSHESELLAGDDLQAAIAWRGVRAEALARRGEHAAAITFAEAAVAIAAATDALLDHADARLALAAALHAGGRGRDAEAEARRAFELWEAKGATLLVERTRRADAPVAAADPAPQPHGASAMRRGVTPNRATAALVAFNAAMAAPDFAAFRAQMSEDYEEIDHPTGTSYGRDANVAALELLMRSRDARCRSEPLATLGDALVLVRRRVSASATGGGRFDVGAYEQDAYTVAEVDGLGRWCRHEVFGGDRLGDALVRFYERHAELLPEGAEQTRAAGMARSLAPTHGRIDLDRLRTAYDPALRCVDHRVFATWAASSAEEMVRHYALQLELAPDFAGHYDEVLAANADVVATRMTFFGTGRDSGGHFENHVTTVFKCGADGRLTRVDIFEGEQTAEALARFDALSGTASERDPGPAPRRARPLRAPRPNAVTRVSAKFEAIIAARDFDGLETFFAEDAECVDHLTGSAYRADGMRTGMHLLMCSPDAHLRFVPLATLGTSWGLVRRELSASGMVAGRFDVDAYELAGVAIFGTDDRGRLRHVELFADEHLGAAVVRLYERYAESLHDAAEATRARGVARSLAAFDGPVDFEGVGNANAPEVEVEDHRVLGTWSARGRAQWMVHWRGQFALADESRGRYDEILALAPAAILAHQTFSGSGRTSGGAFENLALVLHGFDADGLIARTELFEPEHVAAALARFDALAGAGAEALPVRDGARPPRRLQGNAASRTLAAVEAAFTRRDLAAIDALLGDSLETIEHPTATRYGREGQIESSRRMMRLPDLDVRIEPLATLGDELCLARRVVTASGTAGGRFDVGPFEIESIVVTAVDGAGRLASSEVFARDRLCQAIARFCTIYAESLPDGPERTRSEGIASAHAVMGESLDADRIQSLFTASYVCVDHRSLGTWSAEGREDWLRHWREQANLTTGFARRDEDILAFTPAVNVMRHAYFGISRASGGPFENVILCVNVFDDAGRNSRVEIFEPDQEAAALARFDEVIAAEASCTTTRRRVRANTATRSLERFRAIVDARDRDALGDVFAESLHFTHHPTAATYGRREMLATWRSILRAEKVTMRTETLASLGDVLALERHFLSIEGLREDHVAAFGPSELEEITVIEVDERGRWRRVELFAPEHLADAADRLRERYAELLPAGPDRDRAAAIARTAAAAHRGSTDPGAIASVCAPRIEAVDHRLVGFGALRGRDAMVSAARALLDLSEDVRWRDDDVLALSEHASVIRSTQRGRDRATGGAWERPLCTLMVHGADGLLVRWESFEPEQEAEALARFDELVGPARNPAATPECGAFFANAATRALDRVAEVTAARDWEGLADTCAASLRFDDRRPLFRMQLPKEGFLAQHRVLFDVPNARWDMRTIATRGERLTLSQILLQGDVAGGGGALEIDHRGVIEVDDNGRMTAIVLFEPADLDAAYAELDARWQAVEAASHPRVAAYQRAFTRGLADRDWSALASLHAPSLVAVDHRLVGWGELHGPDAYVGALRAMVDLAPDAEGRLDHLRTTEHGLLAAVVWVGTRDGGAFESPFLWVVELDETGRARRLDFYDPHHAERARARFAELDPSTSRAGARRIAPGATADRSAPQTALRASPGRPRDPLAALVKPTLVTAVMERWRAAYDVGFETGRWEAMRPLFAPGFVFDDRRRLVLLRGDIELMLASLRERAASGARAEWTVVGAAGERIMIGRMLWSGGPPDGRFEIEYLGVIEVDEAGLVVANVLYDLDDAPAARREAWTRWAAIDPTVTEWVQTVAEAGPAFDARDRARVRALFADDLVVEDHRWTGFGRTEGAEAYVDSLVALWELTANQRVEFGRFWPVVGRHGAITSIRREGTLSGGGGSFESDYLFLFVAPHGRITRIELFEVADLERALARFEELRPDPLRIPPNAATRAIDRRTAAFEARDWDALRALCDEALVFEDRRRIARTIGDRETFVASNRLVGDVGAHVVREVLATAGERLALERARITAGEAGAEIEVETLVVSEIDADGRLAAIVFFEPDDDRAASRTLAERHLALTRPAALPRLAALFDADGDLARLRAALPDDFVFHDHRRTGLGRLDGPDAYVASVAALHELAPDAIVGQPLYFLADEPHGTLTIARSFGTLANGGAYESVYVMIMRYGPDGTIGGELFELEHLDAARARFADLRG